MRSFTAKFLFALCCAGLVPLLARAQGNFNVVKVNSVSGQFSVQESSRAHFFPETAPAVESSIFGYSAVPLTLHPAVATGLMTLEPAPLVVSCERIKERFLAALDARDDWRSRIEIVINPNLSTNTAPALTALSLSTGWLYPLQFPKTTAPRELIRGVVSALLLEMANRSAGTVSAELPLWLIEGMCAHLEANNLPTFLLENTVRTVAGNVRLDGQKQIHLALRDHSPISFQQLSWPDLRTDEDRAVYRACSQLFLENLLELPEGRAALRSMMGQLGQRLNWQTAFLAAFHARFSNFLAVEKWWLVNCIAFDGASAGLSSNRDCWRQLRDALDVPVKIHLDSSRLPARAVIPLQEMLLTWDTSDAASMIQRALFDLGALRLRSAPELRPLIDGYLTVLQSYVVQEQGLQKKFNVMKNPGAAFLALKKSTCRQLDLLDHERETQRARFLPARSGSELGAADAFRQAQVRAN